MQPRRPDPEAGTVTPSDPALVCGIMSCVAGQIDPADWDEFGERVVAVGTCAHCGEDLDEWEILVEPTIQAGDPSGSGSIAATEWLCAGLPLPQLRSADRSPIRRTSTRTGRQEPPLMSLSGGLAGDAEGVGDRGPVEPPAVKAVDLRLDLVLDPRVLLDKAPQAGGRFARRVACRFEIRSEELRVLMLTQSAALALTHRLRPARVVAAGRSA